MHAEVEFKQDQPPAFSLAFTFHVSLGRLKRGLPARSELPPVVKTFGAHARIFSSSFAAQHLAAFDRAHRL